MISFHVFPVGIAAVGDRFLGLPIRLGIRLGIHPERIPKRIGKGPLSLSHRDPLAALASQPPTPNGFVWGVGK